MNDQLLINRTEGKTIQLKKPIIIGDEITEEITLRKPIVDDLLIMDEAESDIDRQVRLISALAEVPPSTIKKMEWEDFFAVSEVVNGFLPAGQETGDLS